MSALEAVRWQLAHKSCGVVTLTVEQARELLEEYARLQSQIPVRLPNQADSFTIRFNGVSYGKEDQATQA